MKDRVAASILKAFNSLGSLRRIVSLVNVTETFDPMTSTQTTTEVVNPALALIDTSQLEYMNDTTQKGAHYRVYLSSSVEPTLADIIRDEAKDYKILYINPIIGGGEAMLYEVGVAL